jgi:hypothetical protein
MDCEHLVTNHPQSFFLPGTKRLAVSHEFLPPHHAAKNFGNKPMNSEDANVMRVPSLCPIFIYAACSLEALP